jgi:hypothetical protein
MLWDELSRELTLLRAEIKQTIGLDVFWIILPFVILAAVIATMKLTAITRAWWISPYASPKRLLSQLAKVRGVSKSQLRILKAVNPQASSMVYSQMLMDPSLWPAERKSPREEKLYQFLFMKDSKN